jgi:drug/metabolite transporter (DMT)-like permease|eukprot:TRINITY_DN18833_c1_g1_i1.p1 TRINITY_DN18833_c1_g1~~TRINITY_DN18833_c1_g1_i1.p1  ORF type:complete len:352 (+),score=51.69 TRINITY_DN18833_c1_g1_i1:124-1179(+)
MTTTQRNAQVAHPQAVPPEGKSFETWFILFFCMFTYNAFYVCFDVLGANVMASSHSIDPAWTVLLSEIGKFTVSLFLFLISRLSSTEEGTPLLTSGAPAVTAQDLTHTARNMMLPACCYATIDVLNLRGLANVSLSHFAALHQTGVFFTALASMLLIKDFVLTRQKLVALVLLFFGGVLNVMGDDGTVSEEAPSMMKASVVLGAAFISSFGSVLNERVVRGRMSMDPNVQNMLLYSQTTTLLVFYLCAVHATSGTWREIYNFDHRIFGLVFFKVSLGISVSRIIKYGGAMMKQFSASIHIPIEVIIAHFVVHTKMGVSTLAGAFFLAVATGLYFSSVTVSEVASFFRKTNA